MAAVWPPLVVEVEEAVGPQRLQRWLIQYIDLLHRLQLWAPASTVMARCHDATLRRLNKTLTTMSPACAACDAAVALPPSPRLRSENPPPEALCGRPASKGTVRITELITPSWGNLTPML